MAPRRRHANNPIEADRSQLKHQLRPMRGLRTDQTAQTIIAGHAFMQNLPADATNSPSTRPAPNDSPQPFTELTRAT